MWACYNDMEWGIVWSLFTFGSFYAYPCLGIAFLCRIELSASSDSVALAHPKKSLGL